MEVINDLLNYQGLKIYQNPKWFSFSLDSVLLADFVKVNNKISYSKDDKGYIFVSIKQVSYPAHRVIMEYLKGRELDSAEFVDHINRNTSDNSFKNLRLTDVRGNNLNQNKLKLVSNDVLVS